VPQLKQGHVNINVKVNPNQQGAETSTTASPSLIFTSVDLSVWKIWDESSFDSISPPEYSLS